MGLIGVSVQIYHQGNVQCSDAARCFSVIVMEMKNFCMCMCVFLKMCCMKLFKEHFIWQFDIEIISSHPHSHAATKTHTP